MLVKRALDLAAAEAIAQHWFGETGLFDALHRMYRHCRSSSKCLPLFLTIWGLELLHGNLWIYEVQVIIQNA